jgi:hypothetical protein
MESHGTNKKLRFKQFSALFNKTEKFRIIQLSFYTHIDQLIFFIDTYILAY